MSALARYRRLEALHAVGRVPLFGALAGLALLVVSQLLLPLLPPAAVGFLEQAFRIRGMGAIVLLNDYLALYAVVFFVGMTQMLRVVVTPREERQLDLLLAKPLPPSTLLAARSTPVLLGTAALGVALSAGCAVAMLPFVAPGADGSVLGAFGAGLVVTALTLLQLAVANVAFLYVTDSFQALLLSFVVWVLPLLPTSVFLYRPDLFEGRAALTAALVLPANLLWHDGAMPIAAVVGLVAAGVGAAVLVRVGGSLLARLDLR